MATSGLVTAFYLAVRKCQVEAKVSTALMDRSTRATICHWSSSTSWEFEDVCRAVDEQLSSAIGQFMEDVQGGSNVQILLSVEVVH
jgi:hypothetical protein